MYVVRRPFRNLGKVLTVGSTIEDPTVIKHFKSRLAEGKIIVVDEHNYSARAKYFKDKFGVTLPSIKKAEGNVVTEDKPLVTEDKPVTTEVKKAPVKKVVAAAVK